MTVQLYGFGFVMAWSDTELDCYYQIYTESFDILKGNAQ